VEAKPPVCGFYRFENFGVAVAKRVRCPTILEIDVAFAIQIPDEVPLRLVYYDLPHRTETASPRALHFGIEPQTVLEKRNAALKCHARFGTWETVSHCAEPQKRYFSRT